MGEKNSKFQVGYRRLLHHHKLREARKAKGYSQIGLAEATGMSLYRVSSIEQLKNFPKEKEAYIIADLLGEDPIELFPKWTFPVYGTRIDFKVLEVEKTALTSPEVLQLEAPDFKEEFYKKELVERLDRVLKFLGDREAKVLELRFGLHNNKPHLLEEVAQIMGVTRERIRQIEAKALRKLKHPSRRRKLQVFL